MWKASLRASDFVKAQDVVQKEPLTRGSKIPEIQRRRDAAKAVQFRRIHTRPTGSAGCGCTRGRFQLQVRSPALERVAAGVYRIQVPSPATEAATCVICLDTSPSLSPTVTQAGPNVAPKGQDPCSLRASGGYCWSCTQCGNQTPKSPTPRTSGWIILQNRSESMLAKSGFRYPKPPDAGPDPDQVTNDRDRESPEIPGQIGIGAKKIRIFSRFRIPNPAKSGSLAGKSRIFPRPNRGGKGRDSGILAPATEPTR